MKKKVVSKVSGIILFVIGILLLINPQLDIIGTVIGVSVSSRFCSIVGFIFVFISLLLLISDERKYKTKTIDDLESGVSKDTIDSIQEGIKEQYSKMPKETRKSLYQETASIMREVQDGKRSGGAYNLHILRLIPHGLRKTVPTNKRLLEGDAKVLCGYEHQGGRGTERYIFDSDTGDLLGIAYHPRGNPRDLNWRVRFNT